MLRFLYNPIRATIEGVGLLLARLGWIDVLRARRISDLAWPRVLTGVARMSKATADVAMVGLALGATAIAGVGYAVPYWTLAYMLGGGIAGGTISLVSQRFGAGRHRAISRAVKVSAVLSVVATLPLVIMFWTIPGSLIRLLGAEPEAVAFGVPYLQVASLAMPFAALNLIASRTLVGVNDAWSPMVVRSIGAVANIALTGLLIFVLDLGVVGAALGTLLGTATVTGVLYWGLFAGRLPLLGELPVRIRLPAPHWDGDTARHLTRIATPLALKNVVRSGGQFPMLAIVSLFGSEIVAAFVVALRIRALLNTPGWGFGLASSSLIGQALGVGHERKADAYAHDALRFTVAVYAIGGLLVFLFARPVSFLFVSDPDLIPTTAAFIRAACVSVVLWGLMNGAMGPLRASGDTTWPLYGQVIALLLFALPTAYVGAVTPLGVWGLYAALAFETGIAAAIIYYRFRTERWKLISRDYRAAAVGKQ